PSSSGASFTVTASAPAGVYTFSLHAVGSDSSSTTHDAAATLNVVDFNLSSPSVSKLSMGASSASAPISFQVSAAGPFSEAVTLSCSGLPSGAACNFQPSSSINPIPGTPVDAVMTITTAANTIPGTFTVAIVASAANGPSKKQNFTLTVGSDYSLTINNPSVVAVKNTSAAFQGKVTNLNGYTAAVNLSCGSGAPPTCTAAPSSVTPASDGTAFTVTMSSDTVQSYNFQVLATGSDALKVSHSVPVVFTSTNANSNFSFSIDPNSQSESIAVGETAKFQMSLSPCTLCGAFPNTVTLSTSGCPPLSTCSLSHTSVAAGAGPTALSFTVQTTAAVTASTLSVRSEWYSLYAILVWIPGLMFMERRKARLLPALLLLFVLACLALTISCGGGLEGGRTASANPGTPAGSYFLTVTAAMNSSPSTPTQTADLTLIVQ
ncbi:MAG: hypothetical protein JOZ80_02390, partial [Acidobacteriaceae bacterium]|nr:hypothetical protein [Acidobacteriaceae bacterium]